MGQFDDVFQQIAESEVLERQVGSSREPEQDTWRHGVDGIIQKSVDIALASSRVSKLRGEFVIVQDVDCVE